MTFSPEIIAFAGWVPALILPLAALIQLVTIIRNRSTQGVSWVSWGLFGFANLMLYIYTQKYGDVQSILGLLGTAVVDFVIMGLALVGYGNARSARPPVDDQAG